MSDLKGQGSGAVHSLLRRCLDNYQFLVIRKAMQAASNSAAMLTDLQSFLDGCRSQPCDVVGNKCWQAGTDTSTFAALLRQPKDQRDPSLRDAGAFVLRSHNRGGQCKKHCDFAGHRSSPARELLPLTGYFSSLSRASTRAKLTPGERDILEPGALGPYW